MSLFNDGFSINSIIGTGSKITGDLKMNGMVRIDGDLEGDLETTGNVIVGEHARIKGNITAHSVTVIGGIIKGHITAIESVHLLSTAAVIGDIQTHHFQAEGQVIVQGHCIALSAQDEYESAVNTWQNHAAIMSRLNASTHSLSQV